MAYFAVELVFSPDSESRLEIRPKHREFLTEQTEAGALVMSGPWVSDTGALLIYRAEDEAAARHIVEHDPYAADGAGVIAQMRITEWRPVSGQLAKHLEG